MASEHVEEILDVRELLFERGYSIKRLAEEVSAELAAGDRCSVSLTGRTLKVYWGSDRQPQGIKGRKVLRHVERILSRPPCPKQSDLEMVSTGCRHDAEASATADGDRNGVTQEIS